MHNKQTYMWTKQVTNCVKLIFIMLECAWLHQQTMYSKFQHYNNEYMSNIAASTLLWYIQGMSTGIFTINIVQIYVRCCHNSVSMRCIKMFQRWSLQNKMSFNSTDRQQTILQSWQECTKYFHANAEAQAYCSSMEKILFWLASPTTDTQNAGFHLICS